MIGLMIIVFTNKQKIGKVLITVGVIFLYIFSNKYFSNSLLNLLEYRYPPLCTDSGTCGDIDGVRYIVVLDSSLIHDKVIHVEKQMLYLNLSNLIEGIRLYKKINNAELLLLRVSTKYTKIIDTKLMSNIARSSDNTNIRTKDDFQNTYDVALFLKQTLNDTKFILVASASHIPRTVGLLKGLSMNPIPAPANYLVLPNDGFHIKKMLPDSQSLTICMVALHEYFGLVKDKIFGRI